MRLEGLEGLEGFERCHRKALNVGELVSAGLQTSVERVMWGEEQLYLKRPLPSERSEVRLERRERLACEARALRLASAHPLLRGHLRALLCDAQDHLEGLLLRPVEGASLSHLLRASPPLSPTEVAWCVEELTGWLEHIRGCELWAHGDLAPHNIIVTPEGRLALIDWGSAWGPKLPYDEARCVGTPPYRRADAQRSVEERAYVDLYALGALWLKLVTGVSPCGDLSALKASALAQSGWPVCWPEALTALLNCRAYTLPDLRSSLWSFTGRQGERLERLKGEAQASLGLRVTPKRTFS